MVSPCFSISFLGVSAVSILHLSVFFVYGADFMRLSVSAKDLANQLHM